VLAVATASAEWKAELAKKYWTDTYTAGAALQAFLDRERELTPTALRDLGLLPA
jgi:tripartite-type tricarboxylate transporter receptor subunit TctC